MFVTGAYEPAALPGLVAGTGAAIALFLHVWPETFSYTLSEAIDAGLLPVVPDIGAPAERVRATGPGVAAGGRPPERLDASATSVAMLRQLFRIAALSSTNTVREHEFGNVAEPHHGCLMQEVGI